MFKSYWLTTDWKKLRKIADMHNLILIEDSADTMVPKLRANLLENVQIFQYAVYGSHIINCAVTEDIMFKQKKRLS